MKRTESTPSAFSGVSLPTTASGAPVISATISLMVLIVSPSSSPWPSPGDAISASHAARSISAYTRASAVRSILFDGVVGMRGTTMNTLSRETASASTPQTVRLRCALGHHVTRQRRPRPLPRLHRHLGLSLLLHRARRDEGAYDLLRAVRACKLQRRDGPPSRRRVARRGGRDERGDLGELDAHAAQLDEVVRAPDELDGPVVQDPAYARVSEVYEGSGEGGANRTTSPVRYTLPASGCSTNLSAVLSGWLKYPRAFWYPPIAVKPCYQRRFIQEDT